jgi:hypothetical protein
MVHAICDVVGRNQKTMPHRVAIEEVEGKECQQLLELPKKEKPF